MRRKKTKRNSSINFKIKLKKMYFLRLIKIAIFFLFQITCYIIIFGK